MFHMLLKLIANPGKQTANHHSNVAMESWKLVHKGTSGLTLKMPIAMKNI
jgi:uncharacterized membrane protein